MSQPEMRLRIYGARGSYASTSGKASSIGVNTTCLRVDIGKNILIFDAGSGIIPLGNDLIQELKQERGEEARWKVHLLFTHMHIDHLVGFPYFSMLYVPRAIIHFIGPRILDYDLKEVLHAFVHPPFFPVSLDDLPFEGHFHQIAERNVIYFYEDGFHIATILDAPPEGWQARISCMRNYLHPKGGTFFYRIETRAGRKVVFASDTEGFIGGDQRLIEFARNADLLFHDAQYVPSEYQMFQGFGHSTYEMACEIAQKAGVQKLLLFHHDPNHDDAALKEIEQKAQKLFPRAFVASESMQFEF
ncbi:MAG: MBL fold metallo-hydrolase [Calditrichaeota bacterium]|nr:MAG: MBL fold metallo-hydrolase [Calditrichota bacterium]